MCGILGVLRFDGESPAVSDAEACRMRDRMAARGPDDATLLRRRNVVFGHRRLAIRDAAGGRQPWVSNDGHHALVYNGEIYNDRDLREELGDAGYRFETRCDTEVLMAAWQHWGPECVHRLRGMFAFGVYDFRCDRLFLARDRCGVKPLFYAPAVGGDVVFASAIAAIVAHPGFVARPNLHTISHYLTTLRLTMSDDTLFQGIHTLRPAETAWIDSTGIQKNVYWAPPTSSTNAAASFEEVADVLESTLKEAVSIRMTSDVPVGMMISGGVDSSTLACITRDLTSTPVTSRCGGGLLDGSDLDTHHGSDFTFARHCADHVGSDFGTVAVKSDDYRATWIDLVSSYDTPVSTPTDAIIHRVATDLRSSVGVALGGEGADEACCGYEIPHWAGNDFDLSRRLESLTSHQATLAQQSLIQQYGCDSFESAGQHYLMTNSLIPVATQAALFNPDIVQSLASERRIERYYDALFAREDCKSTGETTAHVLLQTNLESLLSRLDSATMAASLESRVPFTDHVLIEQLFESPYSYRIDVSPAEATPWRSSMDLAQRGTLRSKRLIRAVARRMMPAELADRPKASFPTPLASWINTDWKPWIDRTLVESPFAKQIFNEQAIAELTRLPPGLSMWKWPLVNLVLWGDRHFT